MAPITFSILRRIEASAIHSFSHSKKPTQGSFQYPQADRSLCNNDDQDRDAEPEVPFSILRRIEASAISISWRNTVVLSTFSILRRIEASAILEYIFKNKLYKAFSILRRIEASAMMRPAPIFALLEVLSVSSGGSKPLQ